MHQDDLECEGGVGQSVLCHTSDKGVVLVLLICCVIRDNPDSFCKF